MKLVEQVRNTADALNFMVSTARSTKGELKPPIVPEDRTAEVMREFNPLLSQFIDSAIAGLEDPEVFNLLKACRVLGIRRDRFWREIFIRDGDYRVGISFEHFSDGNGSYRENSVFLYQNPTSNAPEVTLGIAYIRSGKGDHLRRFYTSDVLEGFNLNTIGGRDTCVSFLNGICTISTELDESIKSQGETIPKRNQKAEDKIRTLKEATLMVQKVLKH